VGANAENGLRRTNGDKRKAVKRLLNDKEWSKWSNNQIAKTCSVSDFLVASIKTSRGSLPDLEVSHANTPPSMARLPP
jgi:hypothetical protein